MASLQEYLEKHTTQELDGMLVMEGFGRDEHTLSSIYLICRILARREPQRGSARDIFVEFAYRYATNMDLLLW